MSLSNMAAAQEKLIDVHNQIEGIIKLEHLKAKFTEKYPRC